jgi:hypothetical protein
MTPQRIEKLIYKAHENGSIIVVVLDSGEYFCEGIVQNIYEKKVIKFATRPFGKHSGRTGFLLLSDVHDVLD